MRIRSLSMWVGLLATFPSLALAEPRVAVGEFSGPGGRQLRASVVHALQHHRVLLVPPKRVAAVARSSGAELDTESGRVRVADRLHLRGFIDGHTQNVRGRLRLTVTVYSGGDGMEANQWTATGTRSLLEREIKARLWDSIAPALAPPREAPQRFDEVAEPSEPPRRPSRSEPEEQQVAPAPTAREAEPPPPQAADAETENPEALTLAEHADQEETTRQLPPAFDLGIGARLGTRDFAYSDSLPGLQGYSLGVSPSVALHAHWYPGAHFSDGAFANLGLDLRGEMLVGVTSKNSKGQTFSTSAHAFGVGLRGRIPLGALELGPVVGFGQRAFSLTGTDQIDPGVPNVVYNFIRAGLEANWQFSQPVALQLRAGYLFGLSLGQIADRAWFPHGTGNGVEAEAGFVYGVSRMFALELAFGMERYFMALNPEPNDSSVRTAGRVAGGALDRYYSSRLGIIIRP